MVIDMFKSAAILILLLIASRFIDSPPNFSPLLAVAIFIPRITKNENKGPNWIFEPSFSSTPRYFAPDPTDSIGNRVSTASPETRLSTAPETRVSTQLRNPEKA